MGGPISSFLHVGENATNNLKSMFNEITPLKGLRLVVLVCAYLLIRKYVLQHAAKRQEKQLEAEIDGAKDQPHAQISPNQLRGGAPGSHMSALEQEGKTFKYPGIPYDTDDEEDEADGKADGTATGVPEWGKKARRRQRRALRALVDAAEKQLQEKIGDDEDKDIEEFLVDGK